MHPVIFQLGRFRLFSYGLLIAAGGAVTVRFWLARREKMGLKKDEDLWLLVNAILIGGFVGGRVLFVLEYVRLSGPLFWKALLSVNEGFSVLGAFASVMLGVYLCCRLVKAPFLRVWDYVCVGAPLWHAFGRVGCFLAGCCYGKPAPGLPWAVVFTDPRAMVEPRLLGVPLHPTQLYEAVGNAAIFFGLWKLALPRLEAGRLRPGSLAACYFGAYAVLRFGLEFFRADAVPTPFLGLTAGQELCAALAAAAVILAWPRRSACTPS